MNLLQYKNILEMAGNRNCKFVTVKADRVCRRCGVKIPKGTSCLTINPKGKGRRWMCENCVCVGLYMVECKARMDSIPFGDEGGYLAAQDAYEEACCAFYSKE